MEKEIVTKIFSQPDVFLKAMGEDFGISARHEPIKIDNQPDFIDLLLYNRGIPCTVLVTFKEGKLDSGDIGQMNKYVDYYKKHNKQYEYEKDPIGLILYQDGGKEEVVHALDGLEKKIFAAKYNVTVE